MVKEYKTYAVRLDPQVAEYYEELAKSGGIRTSKLFTEILTNNFQSLGIKHQVDRIEGLVEDLEVRLDNKLDSIQHNMKFYEHFGTVYMLLMWLAREGKISESDLRLALNNGSKIGRDIKEGN
jgi:hypothetical protein